jgi:hypothetical protein
MDGHARNCKRCRATLVAAGSLRHKRLGHHERRQLLAASSPQEEPVPIYPPGRSAAAQTATRRAVARLVEHGLVVVDPRQLRLLPGEGDATLKRLGRKYAVLRVFSRTLFGEEIVRHYPELAQPGVAVRWTEHLDAAMEAALARCPGRAETRSAQSGGEPER